MGSIEKDTVTPMLNDLKENIDTDSFKALGMVGDEALRQADMLVPMDTGNLRKSGKVEKKSLREGVLVGYHTKYARRLHEHPEYNFRKDRNPKAQCKWLETALKNNLNSFQKILGKRLRIEMSDYRGNKW